MESNGLAITLSLELFRKISYNLYPPTGATLNVIPAGRKFNDGLGEGENVIKGSVEGFLLI